MRCSTTFMSFKRWSGAWQTSRRDASHRMTALSNWPRHGRKNLLDRPGDRRPPRDPRLYIARDSETYAAKAVDHLLTTVEPLERFPRMGRMVPEYARADLRELIVYSYRVIYRIEPGAVHIIGVIHGA